MENQNWFAAIARNFPYGTISVFDKDLRYVFIDGKELYELGIDGQQLIGRKFIERLAPEIASTVEMQLKKVLEGETVNFELQFRDQYYVLNAVPLPDSSGEIKQILMVERNITQRKKADEEMQKNLVREKELNELKSRFVSMASHEFRTPLSTILSSITLLEKYKKSNDEEKYSKHINRIRTSVHNLTVILNDFLSLDKLEDGKISFTPLEFNIESLMEEIIEEMQLMAKQGQKLEYSKEGKFKALFQDPQILRNIMVNLISNAIKYSPENRSIKIECSTDKNHFIIKVIDKGIGIPVEDIPHLFGRFFRGHNVSHIQGTGLGLNIVKKYLDLMNGEIKCLKNENGGTTFIINFPVKFKKHDYEKDIVN
jgi:signal transduction histidine kinase